MNSTEIQELELDIQQAQRMKELGEAVSRLYTNPDFKKVIEEEYFKEYAVRLVHLKSEPNMQTEANQAKLLKEMSAIGSLHQFFLGLVQQGRMAEGAIRDAEEAITEIRQENVNE